MRTRHLSHLQFLGGVSDAHYLSTVLVISIRYSFIVWKILVLPYHNSIGRLFLAVFSMKTFLILCTIAQAFAFAPVQYTSHSKVTEEVTPAFKQDDFSPQTSIGGAAGFATGALALLQSAGAEDIEYAELPPPYIPVAFGLALVAGVGLLTGSLGNVIDEEASLGMQSGARARKDIERSRSSYFKKK